MTTITLQYGMGPQTLELDGVEQVDAALDAIHTLARLRGVGEIVYLIAPEGSLMFLGLGRDDLSILTWVSADGTTSYLPGDLDGGKPTEWAGENQLSEIPPGSGVPVETVREAAREFARTGRRPTSIAWVDDASG